MRKQNPEDKLFNANARLLTRGTKKYIRANFKNDFRQNTVASIQYQQSDTEKIFT
ncbi:MAG: hypothetical protein J0H55_15820 [Chitinophagaceae bacterium]|nr:hypothetical protein [Chitinophagaceae bacterium]